MGQLSTTQVRRSVLGGFRTAAAVLVLAAGVHAQSAVRDVCPRPAPGAVVAQPEDVRSQNGVLTAEIAYRSERASDGGLRYCYIAADGSQAPTLRAAPGDLVVLKLKNELDAPVQTASMAMEATGIHVQQECAGKAMTPVSTNLHFHGINLAPTCNVDDVLHTWIQPGDAPFEYRFRIPHDQPPGLYWYHPHVHGFTKVQVLGGASGALIIEGIERANRALAGLPERVIVIRDQDLLHPNAQPAVAKGEAIPPVVLDRDGDIMNTGTGTGKPAKDLSVNFVPVPYPDYPPAVIQTRPAEKQLWRVVNASAITYLNLQILYKEIPQQMGVVALDGEPLTDSGFNGNGVILQNHLGLAPGARVEFILTSPPAGVSAKLVTRSVNTGPAGENDPTRSLASIVASNDAPELTSRLASDPTPMPRPATPWLGSITPVRTRHLYFTEIAQDPRDPNSPTVFMLTVEGQTPKPYDMSATEPNIVAHQGDVEDWVIENRTQEVHAFHIHQLHFLVLDWFGVKSDESFLRDIINVPFWDGRSAKYPSVRLRMDFRDPEIVGTFVYHCHLLEHEDGGMMGTIRVEASAKNAASGRATSTGTTPRTN